MKRILFNLILPVLFAAATGCAPQEPQEVVYVIVTSDTVNTSGGVSTSVAQVPPTQALPTATTPPPTPTTPPDIALNIANRALLDGYFEEAVETYRLILEQGDSVPLELRAAAAFGMGQAALREGLFLDAVNSLTTLISQFPSDPRIAQAYFMRADAYMGLSRWQEAITDYQMYLQLRPGLVDSYAYEGMGDAQVALGQQDAALNSYTLAINASRSLVPELAMRERVAQIHLSNGLTSQAVAQYDEILAVAQNAPYRATIEFAAASALINSGETQKGLQRMLLVFENYADTPQAYQAMNILLENNVTLDSYERGRVSFYFGDYEGAITLFSTYGTQMQLAAIPADLHLMLGRAYREIGNSAAALTAFQTIIDQYPQDPLFGEALLEQGRTRFLANDISGAITQYLFIADNYGYLEETAAEALWRAGYLYSTNDQQAEARTIFQRLADEYPTTELASSGLFIAASAAVNAGDNLIAETLFARLATTTENEDQAAAYLWVGRLASQRGDQQTAENAYTLAIQAAPDSYYAARARDITGGLPPFTPPASYRFEFDDVAQLTEAENWLRTTFGVTQEGALWPLSSVLEEDERVVRGRELWALGHFADAETEFFDVLETYETDGLASYQLAIMLRGIGAYEPSIVGAANVIRSANISTLEAPMWIARMRYPTYYRDIVLEVAQRRDIDPLLIFSLIRHESLFDTNATAAAGEKGLTQVIPSTGEYIAGELNWPDYQHSDLFRPYAGIEFGAFYIDEQLETFDGNTIAALSGYNAGPGRAYNWLELSGGDPDLFMMTITIDSTRLYVERIYGYYGVYRALYGEG